MRRRNAPRKSKSLFIIYLTFFLLFSIPLIVWGTVSGSFDIRNKAFDDVTVSDTNPCVISLPNVNPYTLEVGKSITVQVDATLKDAAIASLSITDSTGNSIYQQSFSNSPLTIATSFKFTPTKSGMVDMLGLVNKVGGGSVACTISSSYDVLGLKASTTNQKPTFTSLVSASKPSQNIKTDVTYEYTLTANDPDGDRINYSYSFTPNADWLKPTIIEDGSNGKLTIKFSGSTNKAASYLANVFIHDGYSDHLSSQTWVISVSPATNDIPIVKIITPTDSSQVAQGTSFKTSWAGSDLNQIVKYELYMSKNPTDQSSWITVNNNIAYNVNSYLVDTSKLSAGTYKLIVKATDNQSPALSGIGVSPEIVVTGSSTSTKEDDVVVIEDPQVTNMTPTSTDTISNKQVTIKATLIAGTNAKIDDKTIVMKLDNKDITSSVSINKISDTEHSVIYQPSEDLTAGLHKAEVTFSDSNENSVTKAWTFTITETQTTTTAGYVTIFGLEISQRTLIIIGVGVLVVILAIVAPIIIFKVWKDEQNKNEINSSDNPLINSLPTEPIPFTPSITSNEEVTNLVETPAESNVVDVWDSYAAPEPVKYEEQVQTIQTPIPPEVPDVPIQESKVVVEETPVAPIEPVQQPEVVVEETPVVPITPTPQPEAVVEETPVAPTTPVQQPEVVAEETPTEPATILPPEPDLTTDLTTSDDLTALYDQIQQVQQEETPTNS